MKTARALTLLAALACTLLMSGCLAVEYKIYRCKLNADGTGSGSITFQNIFSQDNDSTDISASDFGDLISDYLNGSKFEDDTPRIHVTGKRLFEENGKLCAEVTYDFTNADSAGFVIMPGCKCAPVLFVPANGETVIEGNGKVLDAATTLLTWPAGTMEMWYKVSVTTPDSGATHSLVSLYRGWKEGGKKE